MLFRSGRTPPHRLWGWAPGEAGGRKWPGSKPSQVCPPGLLAGVVSKAAETSETTAKPERDFNANDRVKARLVVDSYYTIPEEIFAGEEFELVVNMKNASQTVAASNILFSFESEKVSESAVFTIAEGSNSVVVNALAPNATSQISVKMKSKPVIDQILRSDNKRKI